MTLERKRKDKVRNYTYMAATGEFVNAIPTDQTPIRRQDNCEQY